MLRKLLAMAVFGASLMATSAGPTHAATITWSVSLIMNDSGTGSGSFTIDTLSLLVTSFDITTTPGTSPVWTSTIHYIPATTNVSSDAFHVGFQIPATASALEIDLQSGSLAIAATAISVAVLEENQNLTQGGRDFRSGIGTISAVPVPGALPLFITGLGVLGLLGWRRKRKGVAA